jgi:hypothetical protein
VETDPAVVEVVVVVTRAVVVVVVVIRAAAVVIGAAADHTQVEVEFRHHPAGECTSPQGAVSSEPPITLLR